jgi:hypothetical protein
MHPNKVVGLALFAVGIAAIVYLRAASAQKVPEPAAFRQLTTQEIQMALAVPQKDRGCTLTPLEFKPAMRLPKGVTIEYEGYMCMGGDDAFRYTFLQANTPPGKEILFACKTGVPAEPHTCGAAVIDKPYERVKEMEDWKVLNESWMLEIGDEERSSAKGKEYLAKLMPQLEATLVKCPIANPNDEQTYAWLGRISTKGKVNKSAILIVLAGPRSPDAGDTRAECILNAMRSASLPPSPDKNHVLLWNGWPAVLYWKHGPKGDQVWIDRASAEASNESN